MNVKEDTLLSDHCSRENCDIVHEEGNNTIEISHVLQINRISLPCWTKSSPRKVPFHYK